MITIKNGLVLLGLCFICSSVGAATMDARVRRVPKNLMEQVFVQPEETLPQVVANLTAGVNDTRTKVKILHDWICDNIAYDTDIFTDPDLSYHQQYDEILKKKAAFCSGYANLFRMMCSYAKIECVAISGWSKGVGYTGELDEQPDHAWNAVKLGGQWLLVDVTWDAGYVDWQVYIKHYTTEWFLKPAEQFIYSHLPKDDTHQFLSASKLRTPELFVSEPYVPCRFFEYGFALTKTAPEYTNLLFDTAAFDFTLSKSTVQVRADIYTMQNTAVSRAAWVDRDGNKVTVCVDVPDKKSYRVRVSARNTGEVIVVDHIPIQDYEKLLLPNVAQLLAEKKITQKEADFWAESYYKVEQNGLYYLQEDLFATARNNAVLKILKLTDYATSSYKEVLYFDVQADATYAGFGNGVYRFPTALASLRTLRGTRLQAPRVGVLERGSTQTISISSRDYSAFAIFLGDEQIDFVRNPKTGIYELELTVPAQEEKLYIYGSSDRKNYAGLWYYVVQ